MEHVSPYCVICKKKEESFELKVFKKGSLETAKNAAGRRKALIRDSFAGATEYISSIEGLESHLYHSQCLSRFMERALFIKYCYESGSHEHTTDRSYRSVILVSMCF